MNSYGYMCEHALACGFIAIYCSDKKLDIGNHRYTQIKDTDRNGFNREVFKKIVFIRVYLCPSVVKNFIVEATYVIFDAL